MKKKRKAHRFNSWGYYIGLIILFLLVSTFTFMISIHLKKQYNLEMEMIVMCSVVFCIVLICSLILIVDNSKKNRSINENYTLLKSTMVYSNQFCTVYNFSTEKYLVLNYGNNTQDDLSTISLTKEMWESCIFSDDLPLYNELFKRLLNEQDVHEETISIKKIDEEQYRHYSCTMFPLKNRKGKIIKALCIATDIEESYNEKIKLQEQIEYDNFTGLLNRLFFEKKVKECLNKFEKKDRAILILLDIDGFKSINDILRHSFGDEVIKYTANVLKETFRKTDLIARLGGDEFLIWVEKIGNLDMIEERLNALQTELAKKLLPGTKNRYLSASIGVVLVRKGDTYESLYNSADDAMYTSKRAGRGLYTILGYEVNASKDKQQYKLSQTIKEQYILDQVIKNVSVPYYAIYYFDSANNNYYCYKENGEMTIDINHTGITTDLIQDFIISYVHPDDIDLVRQLADFEHFKDNAKKNDDGTYSKIIRFRRFFEDHYVEIEVLAICNLKTALLPEIITVFFKKLKG